MKEYGGYLEYEKYRGKEYYPDAISLNCGRNCLHYLIESRKIKKINLPYFLCNSVRDACKKAGVSIRYYHIDDKFRPILDFQIDEEEYLYIVNFYGQLEKQELNKWGRRHRKVIVDNAQSFFDSPLQGMDTIYVLRKYFGVADGAYLITDSYNAKKYSVDISHERMSYLMGRYEENASKYYMEYKRNEEIFRDLPIMEMSMLTHNLLRGIDYNEVKRIRKDNFTYLHTIFEKHNELNLRKAEGPFAYPLLIENGYILRKELQKKDIYIPTLWPNVLEECDPQGLEYRYARDILPLPVDQRYNTKDMEYIAEVVQSFICH